MSQSNIENQKVPQCFETVWLRVKIFTAGRQEFVVERVVVESCGVDVETLDATCHSSLTQRR